MSQKSSLKSKQLKKEEILNKAIKLISNNGFKETTIEEITNYLGIAKGTFYLYFKSKKDLLIDCIGKLTTIVVRKEVWEDIRKETDYASRHEKRLVAFLEAFPTFCGILNLLKSCLQTNDPVLVKKAIDTYKMLVNPLRKDLRWAIEHGVMDKSDEEVVSFLLFGMGESMGYLLMIDPRYTLKYVTKIVMNFSLKGSQLLQTEPLRKSKTENCYWDLRDVKGQSIRLNDIRFEEENYLRGSLGYGEYRIPVENITRVNLHQEGSQMSATVAIKDGEMISLKIDENIFLTGECKFGQYTHALKHICTISLVSTTGDQGSKIIP